MWNQIRKYFTSERKHLVAFVRTLMDDAAQHDAEDIVQDVAFNLFEKGNLMEPVENLAAYIYRALRNRVVDNFRKTKDNISLDETIGDEEGLTLYDVLCNVNGNPDSDIERKDLFDKAEQIMRQLPENEKAVIYATEVDGYTFAELSQQWEVPVGTLLSLKSRALHKVRYELQSLK